MFHSAVVKLTSWYLLILMSISLLFSVAVYNVATNELSDRLNEFEDRFEQTDTIYDRPGQRLFSAFRNNQRETANRNIFWTLAYVNLLILLGGGALSYMLARRTLQEIEHAHDAQSRFTSDASHELRTPLAVMKSELEVALRDPKLTKQEMRELLQSNLEEVDRLTILSKTLLQLSKLDYANIDFEQVNLGNVAADVIQRYDKNLSRIVLQQPKTPLFIKANPASIEELLTILIDNALKYSPPKSKITALVSARGRHVVFSITNGGAGIPQEKLPRIFDRFYRADESRTVGGAGLGLALAKEIVGLHKGEMSVSSNNEQTTFTVSLHAFRKN